MNVRTVHTDEKADGVPELLPAEGEPRIHTQHNSSFEDTALEAELAGLGATHIARPKRSASPLRAAFANPRTGAEPALAICET